MDKRYFLPAVMLCLMTLCSLKADAHQRKKSKSNFKLIEAYSRRTLPGIPNAPIRTSYYFIIAWEAKTYPKTFFWRGENGWLTCSINKAHKAPAKKGINSQENDYIIEQATGDAIHKGDTLELKPIPGGKFPIPAEIPASAKNTLYYKTGGSGWLSFPVKNIGKKPDIAMP